MLEKLIKKLIKFPLWWHIQQNINIYIYIIFTRRKVIMSLRHQGLVRVKENEKILVRRKDNKRMGFSKSENRQKKLYYYMYSFISNE